MLYERAARWNPGIFTISGQPGTQGAVLNRDGTVNSNANPGRLGSVISLFATGMGALSPSGVDGQISPIPPPWITLACQPLVMVAGVSAAIRYAGAAPGFGCGSYSNQRPTSSFSPARDFTECGSGKHQRMRRLRGWFLPARSCEHLSLAGCPTLQIRWTHLQTITTWISPGPCTPRTMVEELGLAGAA